MWKFADLCQTTQEVTINLGNNTNNKKKDKVGYQMFLSSSHVKRKKVEFANVCKLFEISKRTVNSSISELQKQFFTVSCPGLQHLLLTITVIPPTLLFCSLLPILPKSQAMRY